MCPRLLEHPAYFFYHIYPLFTRKRIVSSCFERYVRTRLGVAISEVSGPLVFHIKVGRSVKCLAKDTTSELAGLFSTALHKCRGPSKEAKDTIF